MQAAGNEWRRLVPPMARRYRRPSVQMAKVDLRLNSIMPGASVVPPLTMIRFASSSSANSQALDDYDLEHGPQGDLFDEHTRSLPWGPAWIGMEASIRRTFPASDNAKGLLVSGGEALARHASFDPNYQRARGWIRSHPVGPAIVSPVLIQGLVGTLVEAALPNSVPVGGSWHQYLPLIVGVDVNAQIRIVSVEQDSTWKSHEQMKEYNKGRDGYKVGLQTRIERVQDGSTIADGTHKVWIPETKNKM